MDGSEVERFAREDPKIKRHLDVARRKEGLERVLREMEGLRMLEGRERRREDGGTGKSAEREKRRGWFS